MVVVCRAARMGGSPGRSQLPDRRSSVKPILPGTAREYQMVVRTPFPAWRPLFPLAALALSLIGCGRNPASFRPDSPYLRIVPPSEEGDDKIPPAVHAKPVRTPEPEPDPDMAVPEILPDSEAEGPQGAG